MAVDLNEARKLATVFACEEYPGSFTVTPSDLPDPGVYGFDPNGWAIFVVIDKVPDHVGGSEYVAVNLDTGEARTLGIIGE